MTAVTFSSSVGGDGSTVSDDSSPTTGLAGYGYVTRLVPAFAQIVAVANFVVGRANAAASSASAAASSASTASTKATEAASSAATASTKATEAANSAAQVATFASEASVDMGSGTAINLNSGRLFYKTISVNTSLSVTNVPAGPTAVGFTLELTNGGSKTILWWSGIKWDAGIAPTLTASGVDILGFYTRDGGATWRGILLVKDSK